MRGLLDRQEDILSDRSVARSDAELLEDIRAFERDSDPGGSSSSQGELFEWALQVKAVLYCNGRHNKYTVSNDEHREEAWDPNRNPMQERHSAAPLTNSKQ